MDNIAKVRAEILRLKLEVYDEAHQFDIGARCSLTYLDSFLDTLQEPSLPSDVDEAAKQFVGYDMDTDELRDYEIGISSFKAGVAYDRAKMLEEAVEGEISSVDVGDDSYIKTIKMPELQKAIRNYNLGDKVRILVLKAEEKQKLHFRITL